MLSFDTDFGTYSSRRIRLFSARAMQKMGMILQSKKVYHLSGVLIIGLSEGFADGPHGSFRYDEARFAERYSVMKALHVRARECEGGAK